MSTLSAIAITPGDPCGIGPEIIARAFLNDALSPQAMPATKACFVAGSSRVMQKAVNLVDPQAQQLKLKVIQKPAQAMNLPLGVIPVLQVATLDSELPYGEIHAESCLH